MHLRHCCASQSLKRSSASMQSAKGLTYVARLLIAAHLSASVQFEDGHGWDGMPTVVA